MYTKGAAATSTQYCSLLVALVCSHLLRPRATPFATVPLSSPPSPSFSLIYKEISGATVVGDVCVRIDKKMAEHHTTTAGKLYLLQYFTFSSLHSIDTKKFT